MNKKGLAQIPLMIGLLVMAVAVPVATKLVQQSQDTRNQAAGCTSLTVGLCGVAAGCPVGKKCIYTTYGYSCAGTCASPTPTSTPRPPTPTPNPNACNSVYETRKCVNSAEYTCTNNVWVKTKTCSGPCVHNACPTPTTCLELGDPCTTESCCSGLKCSGGGYGAFECIPDTTISPPVTATPTLSGCSASKLYQCGSLGGCGVGYRCMLSGSYYCKYDSSCPGGPTNTPKPPTATVTTRPRPTDIPCASTGQSCSTRQCCTTADVCTDEGLSYPKCVPRNQVPTYIPIPTIDCAKSGQGCSTRPCCEPYLDVCTDEGLAYPKCVPRNQIPTYIPVPTQMPCAVTGGNCSSSLGCCAMTDKCTNGKCIAPVPTGTNPTGTNPTNIPTSPSGGCSGSKPADKCESKTLFINAQCVNNRWDWDEQSCNSAGRTESCGGKNYCCPSTGGAWTTDMSKCPTTCTQCVGKPEAKSKGDADCSGVTNLNDFSIWRDEFITGALGVTAKNSWRADFDCNGKVSLNDFSIWRDNFIKSL